MDKEGVRVWSKDGDSERIMFLYKFLQVFEGP